MDNSVATVTGDRGDIDEVAGFLPRHVRQRGGDAIQHALDVHIEGAFPVLDVQALNRCKRHDAGIVQHHVHATELLHGSIHQFLHLVAMRHVRVDGKRLAAV